MISPDTTDCAASPRKEVLIAEDNAVNQMLMRQVVTKMGLSPTIVGNGQKCVEEWGRRNYALILMDLQMPEMSGLQATEAIRALEKQTGARIPIIAVTANALPSDREACMRSGMDGFVAKPLRIPQLQTVIAQFLGGTSAEPEILLQPDAALAQFGGAVNRCNAALKLLAETVVEAPAKIQVGLINRDACCIAAIASDLRNACCRCGADTSGKIAASIERAARAEDLIGAAVGLAEFRKHSGQLLREIETLQNRIVPAGQS